MSRRSPWRGWRLGESEGTDAGSRQPGRARVAAVSVQTYDWAGVGISTPLQGRAGARGLQRDQDGTRRVQQAAAGWKQQCWPGWGDHWHWGGWLVGAQSSARCRWSRGEAGWWRGIWLSCWRSTGGEREGGSAGRRAGPGRAVASSGWSLVGEPEPALSRQSRQLRVQLEEPHRKGLGKGQWPRPWT